jgi:hypothetical protein
MSRASTHLAAAVLCAAAVAAADVFLQGTVENSIGTPIAGALVQFSGGGEAETDDEGRFLISSLATGAGHVAVVRTPSIRFQGTRVRIDHVRGKRVAASLFDARGRKKVLLAGHTSERAALTLSLHHHRALAAGTYILRLRLDEELFTVPFTSLGTKVLWSRTDIASLHSARGLGKRMAGNLTASADGYASRQFGVSADTAVDLQLTLYPSALEVPQAVSVSEGTETKPFRLRNATGSGTTYAWCGTWFEQYNNLDYGNHETRDVQYNVIHLDNGLLTVSVSPDLGMRVIRVEDKVSGDSRQLFAVLDDPVNGVNPAWQDIGGVEPSFPFYEAGTAIIDDEGNLCSKSGYYIDRRPDGTVRVVMNRRADHHQTPRDIAFLGRYGDRPLVGVVTLRPGQACFSVKYIGQNPNPLRRSNRIWNDALFPYEADEKIIFPCKYAMRHGAYGNLIDLHEEFPDGITNYINPYDGTASFFGFDPPYPFAGVYYPGSDANHLRITDPARNPGYKLYVGLTTFTELWGSTNPVFEAPDTFVNAFEPVELAHSFYMVRGIGEVAYANEYVAIATPTANTFKLSAPVPAVVDVYDYDDDTSPILAHQAVGPGIVLEGGFSAGLRVIAGGHEVCNVRLPLVFSDDTSAVDRIRLMAHRSGGWTDGSGQPADRRATKATLDAGRMYNYELEGPQNRTWMLNSLGALIAVGNVTAQDDPDVLVSLANTAYRHGAFGGSGNLVVEQYLSLIGDRRPRHTNYLRGLMALEKGESADFSNTLIEGAYFRALDHIANGHSDQAVDELNELLAQRPDAIRPRLVRAYLRRDLHDALYCLERVPGAIECWAVLDELGYPGAADNLTSLLQQEGGASVRYTDFIAEVTEGSWRHERRIEYVMSNDADTWFHDRHGQPQAVIPPFPSFLKY